jgi:hypothetical protein
MAGHAAEPPWYARSMAGARADGATTQPGAAAGAPPPRDWTLRAFEALPVPPIWTGLALVLVYVLLAGVIRLLAPSLAARGFEASPAWIWELVNGLVIATPLTLNAYARRGALADLRELRAGLDLDDAGFARWSAETTSAPASWLAAASGVSVAVMLAVVLFDPSIWGQRGRPGPRDPLLYWALLHNAAAAYAFGRMLAMEGALTRGFGQIAERVRIDLLDPEPLFPLARKGQRSVLLWILLSSCLSLFWFGGDPAVINAFVLVLALGVAASAFALPLSRVRARIVAAKRAEIARLNDALRDEREGLLQPESAPSGRIADLVAWRGLVEGVAEWPVPLPTLLRSGLFVLIGIGSWLGGALVERLLAIVLP